MTWLFSIGLHNAAVAMLLALLVWVVTRIYKNPPVAHLLWLLVLLKLVTPPLVNFDLGSLGSAVEGAASLSAGGPDSTIARSAARPTADGSRLERPVSPDFPRSDAELAPPPGDAGSSVAADSRPFVSAQWRNTVAAAWGAVRPALVWTWLGGAGLVALVAGMRIVRFQRMLAGTLPASQRIQSLADELATRMDLRRSPDVRVVDGAAAPLVWRLGRRATVVVPLRLLGALDERQTAMVLAHELAHLRRGDHWVRVIELLVSVLYWWNPLVWWVGRRLHAAEEQCCDAWVAWVYPDLSHDYAQSLLKAAELAPTHASPLVLASPFLILKNPHALKERIEMVLKNRSQRTLSRKAAVWIALLAAVVMPAGVQRAAGEGQAGTTSPKVATKAPPASVAGPKALEQTPPADAAEAEPARDRDAIGEKPIAKEFQPFQGVWNFGACESALWQEELDVIQKTWKWVIQGREITWIRPGKENVKLSFAVDPSKTPNRIDFTFLNGPDEGEKCQGIFEFERASLWICMTEPGAKVARPTAMEMTGSSKTTLIILEDKNKERTVGAVKTGPTEGGEATLPIAAADKPAAKEPAAGGPAANDLLSLQGVWNFDIYYSNWWPGRIGNPPVGWSAWRWTVKGNEIAWTGMKGEDVKLSFTLDPSKSPRQIDLTFLDGPHKGKRLRGIYELNSAASCWICFADPDANVDRPTDVSYSSFKSQTMVYIQRAPAEQQVALQPPAAIALAPPPADNATERGPEVDAAIARLRGLGAFVREFHPRGDPRYWVQIISTGSFPTARENATNIDDAAMTDVEAIGRGVALHLHLRNTSVTADGLGRLATVGEIQRLELTGPNVNDAMLKVLPKLPLLDLSLSSDLLTDQGIQPVADCRRLAHVGLGGKLLTDACLEHLTGLPELRGVSLERNFTHAAFDILARVQGLTDLDASAAPPRLSDLVKFPNLRRLSLAGKEHNDDTARTIAETFTSLEEAYLRDTSITNAGVQHLSRMGTLTRIIHGGAKLKAPCRVEVVV